jgi:serine/threonine protein kinase
MLSKSLGSPIMAKVADFGTATPLYIPELKERVVQQPVWLAPEVMSQQCYNEKVDVYGFGIILWELITKQHPFDEFPFAQWMAQLEDKVISGTRPSIPYDCPTDYKKLIHECWHTNPDIRPSFAMIVRRLKAITEKKTETNQNEELTKRHGGVSLLELQSYSFDLPDTEEVVVKDELGCNIKSGTLVKILESMTRVNTRGKYL